MKYLKKLYYKLIPTYRRLELRRFSWKDANVVLRDNIGRPESEQWRLAKEEDTHELNPVMPTIWLERRERIYG